MRQWLATAVLTGLGLALPLSALAQTVPAPVIAPIAAPPATQDKTGTPVWMKDGNSLSVMADGRASATAPTRFGSTVDGRTFAAGAGVQFTSKPGITAHAKVGSISWAPLISGCAAALPGATPGTACSAGFTDGVQRGEVGAGFAGNGLKLDLSVGKSQSESTVAPAAVRRMPLPRVLPSATGAGVAAPLWFRNSTATSISAHGQLNVAPDTSVDLGARVGRVQFLPGSGVPGDDSVDQTTLSLGIRHGAVRGAIVGHVLEPNLPGAALDRNQRWSGIDLGISVRLPWRGELNFGAQNVWTSGHAPLLFGPGATPDQGRVPYVQYHQIL